MILQKLEIEVVPSYRANAGQYEGKAVFAGDAGAVSLKLTPALCDKMFVICAEGILGVAKEAATALTCNMIEHQKQLVKNEPETIPEQNTSTSA